MASGVERRTWVADSGNRIIACVDVQPVDTMSGTSVRSDVLWELAVRRVERCIRPSDWMCLLGGNRLAVFFGNGGHRVPPSVLGSRLAKAMGEHLSVGAQALDVHVSVGISAGPTTVEPAELTGAALAAVRSARQRMSVGKPGDEPHALVTVTHVPASVVDLPVARRTDGADEPWPPSVPVRRLVRRVMVPLPSSTSSEVAVAGIALDPGTSLRQAVGTVPRVLVVDPEASRGGRPRLAVEAVASLARRVGARATVSPSSEPERVLLDLYVTEPHAAVVVLESDTCRRRTDDGSRPWERPARLVRALREAGVLVFAVGIGASAAAVAACIEQGAVGLLDPDELPQELSGLSSAPSARNGNGSSCNGHGSGDVGSRRFPAPFASLVGLTPSERRVLFHMMEGRSAAEIAEALVVSLPTVRSHIRSILRKLNVNSQLAAVAIANGALPDSLVGA